MPPRRTWIIAVLALFLLGAGLWWWLSPMAFVTRVIAAGGEEAVVLSRQNTDRSTSFWLSLQSADGLAWVHRVSGEAWDVSGEGITVSPQRVTYLMQAEQELSVVGLDRETGAVVWTTSLGKAGDRTLSTWLYAPVRAVGDTLLVPYGTVDGQLAALNLSDGALRWREALSSTTELLEDGGEHVWLKNGDHHDLETLRLSDGVRTLHSDAAFNQCLLDGAIYTVRDDALVRLHPSDGPAPIPLPVDGARLHACGTHDGAMILTLSVEQQTVLARIVDGGVTAVLSMDWPHQSGGPNGRIAKFDQSNHALKGAMTRFLPLMFSAMDSDIDTLRWIVVDLTDLTITAEATPQHDYLYFEQIRSGGMHYFWYHGGLLIAVDGETGLLSGAIQGGRSFDGRSVADGVVWMPGEGSEGWQAPRHPAVVWLDGETLAPLGATGKTDAFQPAHDVVTELTGWPLP
ncbi:MAG: hypothetical protein ACI8RZ_001724 [Myxococcota bacterium]|jgi:hypothetical protein